MMSNGYFACLLAKAALLCQREAQPHSLLGGVVEHLWSALRDPCLPTSANIEPTCGLRAGVLKTVPPLRHNRQRVAPGAKYQIFFALRCGLWSTWKTNFVSDSELWAALARKPPVAPSALPLINWGLLNTGSSDRTKQVSSNDSSESRWVLAQTLWLWVLQISAT